jgi:hypothetical protein
VDEVELAPGESIADEASMDGHARPQLGRIVVLPFATIGVIAAVLMWAMEHAATTSLVAGAITGGSIAIGVIVADRVRRKDRRPRGSLRGAAADGRRAITQG